MTKRVEIDLTVTPPEVYVDGKMTSVRCALVFHQGGGLNLKSLTLRDVPNDGR